VPARSTTLACSLDLAPGRTRWLARPERPATRWLARFGCLKSVALCSETLIALHRRSVSSMSPWLLRFGCSVRSWAPCCLDSAALCAPGRPGWFDLGALCAPGRPGWLNLGALCAPGRPGWFDLVAMRTPGRPGWLDLGALCAPGRPGWVNLNALCTPGPPACVDSVANECPNDAISKKKTISLSTISLDAACLVRSATMLHASNLV
jgi:hypothetical protein